VLSECLLNPAQKGAKEISEGISKGLIKPYENPDLSDCKSLCDILGVGEASAIALGIKLNARLLIDEKLGRKVAQQFKLPVIGTAGVLMLAKEKKVIKKVLPIIFELKECGYYLSHELIQQILCKTNEKM